MMEIQEFIIANNLQEQFFNSIFAFTKDTLVVNSETDQLTTSDYPKNLSNVSEHPYIHPAVSQAKASLHTPAFHSLSQALSFLDALNQSLVRSLSKEDYVWPFTLSADQSLPENNDNAQEFMSELAVHFAFSNDFLDTLFAKQEKYETIADLRAALYTKVTHNFTRYAWILVYLFGGSPVANVTSLAQDKEEQAVRSTQNSGQGDFQLTEAIIGQGNFADIFSMRNASSKDSSQSEESANYISLRGLDLNPFSPIGISDEQANFVHLFILYLAWMTDEDDMDARTIGAQRLQETVVEYPLDESAFKTEGIAFLDGMQAMLVALEKTANYSTLLDRIASIFDHPEKTISGAITKRIEKGTDFVTLGHQLGLLYKRSVLSQAFMLQGFTDIKPKEHNDILKAIQAGMPWKDLQDLVFKKDNK